MARSEAGRYLRGRFDLRSEENGRTEDRRERKFPPHKAKKRKREKAMVSVDRREGSFVTRYTVVWTRSSA